MTRGAVYVPLKFLHPHIDLDDLRRIDPDVELLTTRWDGIESAERLARTRDPFAPSLRADEVPLTDDQADAFQRAEVLLTLDLPLDLPSRAPNLRWVQSIGSGVAHYRAARLDEGEILLTNAAGVGAAPIAEWVIGRAVAVRARALGIHVVGLRRSAAPGDVDPDVDELAPADMIADVAARSDIVVLCAAGSQANRDMFDTLMFGAMKPGAWFINVSRGDLVVESALIGALESGHLAGAAIDVARTEPLPPDDPLWDAPNRLISPHISTAGSNYPQRVAEFFVGNFERYVEGEPLVNVVDPTTL
ncbi:MAG: NAD(P)-dependent oxidoreductase [Actinomycetota bacterium]|nr:NAD(P)-dependent oxidoreductase [Actinomycetota bacterium]